MNEMCDNLLQMRINDTMVEKWQSLPSDKILAERMNCAPNVLHFLGLVGSDTANECNYTSHHKGMQPNEIEDILKKYLDKFHGSNKYTTKLAHYNDTLNENNLNMIQSKLTPGYGTVLMYQYMEKKKIKGHAVVLANSVDGILTILDPQHHTNDRDIDGIIKYSDTINITSFGLFCIHPKTKRSITKNNSKRGMTNSKRRKAMTKKNMTNSKRIKAMRENILRKKRGITNSKTKDDDKMVVDK